MKRIFIFLAILALVLCVNVSFAENATDMDIYVSNDGSDSLGDGSVDNPYLTLNYTIEKASDNSNIYLKSGVYNSTGYEIVNKSLTITGMGDVVIDCLDGKLSETIFNINDDSSLVLNNITFINGYAGLETLHCIKNEGALYINNCNFNNFTSSSGIIKNTNYLYLNNVYGERYYPEWERTVFGIYIVNLADIDIYNTNLSDIRNINSKVNVKGSNIKNFRSEKSDVNIIDSSISNIYGLNSSAIIINNSNINHLGMEVSSIVINNSLVWSTTDFKLSDIEIYSSLINFTIVDDSSNITALYSHIYGIFSEFSNLDVHYCSFMGASFRNCTGNVDYNWWGSNKGPTVVSSDIIKYWIVMTFEDEGNSDFTVNLNQYTDGKDIFKLKDEIPARKVIFETESGYFSKNNEYLVNGTFRTALIDNNPDTIIYAKIDNQELKLILGNGYSNYTFYVSDKTGNDYYFDGSFNYPYKTLSKAVSKALSGNTIYVMSGEYTLSWNSNLKVSKEISVIGIGDVTFLRPNARSIFIIEEKGILTIKNINFTSATNGAYYDAFIELHGGDLNISNCNFQNIKAKAVILAMGGNFIDMNNVSFNNIGGQTIVGATGSLVVSNSKISNEYPVYLERRIWSSSLSNQEKILYSPVTHFSIVVSANTTIVNTTFSDNDIGAIYTNCNDYDFGVICNFKDSYNRNTLIYNSKFFNNDWNKDVPYEIGLSVASKTINNIGIGTSLVENCYFYKNSGRIIYASNINDCEFIDNAPNGFVYNLISDDQSHIIYQNPFPASLVKSDLINNSYFYGNTNLIDKSYFYISQDPMDFEKESIISCDGAYNSVFINNVATYGGALFNPSEVHYCVFINNSAIYDANDIFVYSGNLNASSNWWGSNQKPLEDRIHIFIGKLILDDWVIMSLDHENGKIVASLDDVVDNNGNINKLNHIMPSRNVSFSTDKGTLDVYESYLIDNHAFTRLLDNISSDLNVYARMDNQNLSLTVFNNSTKILIDDMTFYGADNPFELTLINVNGHRISYQLLNVIIYKNDTIYDTFTLNTNDRGVSTFNFNYPIGNYKVKVYYAGNGYFDSSESICEVDVVPISTMLTSYNYTYYGKNNKFYAILQDTAGKYILNQVLELKIFDSNGRLISVNNITTGIGGRADVLLSLDLGEYRLKWTFKDSGWYMSSSCESIIRINPIGSTINLLNATFFGKDNDYQFTFKDAYGTLIRGETIVLTISKGNESKKFDLTTDNNGVASITVSLEPGIYNVDASYVGDEIYAASHASAILDIQPVRVTFDLSPDVVIPENGVFTAILVDMYGKKVIGEKVTLDLYNYDLLKSFDVITDGKGEANFRVAMPEGSYFGILNYGGGTWYASATGASKITVNPNVVLNNIYINGSDLIQYYGENKYYVIDFNDSNAYSLDGKIIQVSINSKDWFKSYNIESDMFGKARLKITLEPGVYNITYKYANEYYDIYGEGSSSIFVYKMPTSLLASDLIMNYGEAQFYEVKLVNNNGSPLPNLAVNVTLDSEEYSVVTNQRGVAKILVNPDLGYHNVTYSFDSANYESSKGSSTILVVDGSQTATKLIAGDVEASENELFNYSISLSDVLDSPIVSSEILLEIIDLNGNVIGSYRGFSDNNGTADFNLNLTYGEYLFSASYNGNDNYLASFNTNKIKIKASENVTETILFGSDCDLVNGNNQTSYYVILSTVDGEYIKNQTVEFIVKGESYYSLTDEFGKAYLNVLFSSGSYKVVSRFNGSNNLTRASVTNYISVHGELCYLYSQNIVKSFNNATQYYVALCDSNDLPLSDKIITFHINNESYERLTDENGFACFEATLPPGIYNITAVYQGNFTDEFASVSNNITILTTLTGEDVINYANTNLPVLFFNPLGNPLSNTEVYFVLNGYAYRIKTDANGYGIFNIKLNAGSYKVMAINPLSGENKTFNLKIVSTVSASNLVKYYKGSEKFKATFKDKNGNLLKNTNIKFTLNGRTYAVKTNAKGIASLSINLKPGKYTITTFNTKTGEKKSNTVTVKKTIITNDKTVKANKKINFQAKILKNNGKIAKKVTITFKINKKTYKIKTNNKGIAILNIKLKKGKYTVSITYNGLTVKNKITVK